MLKRAFEHPAFRWLHLKADKMLDIQRCRASLTRKTAHTFAHDALAATALMLGAGLSFASTPAAATDACPGDNGGLKLSPGWCATIFADKLGHARQMVVAPNGVLYVNTWSGVYYDNDTPPDGTAQGSAGGTGIYYYNGALYAEENDKIVRFALPEDAITPTDAYKIVLSGMPLRGDHPMHPFIIDKSGNMFIDMGSATNSCQSENRMQGSPGIKPCTELETRGGTWRYDANKTEQKFSPAERYATGIRNGEGFGLDAAGRLFVTQHGRDQLWQNWPSLYNPKQSAELPAELLLQANKGDDFGWPECYYDGLQKKLVLAPEYGGDGGKTQGVCATKKLPVAFFPAHWAPNDLLIDNDAKVPAAYRGGAFLAFHGSWNRAPLPQGGYNVVFQPLKDGKAAGDFVIFADGFAGQYVEPGRAAFRPSGLAAGPGGAIYISDDIHGRIWRLTYHGAPDAPVAAAPGTENVIAEANNPLPPEGIHPNAGRAETANLPLAPGVTRDQLALGERIFHGEVDYGTCAGCHGSDAKGTSQGPNLTTPKKIWSDGSLAGLEKTITDGVPKPMNYPGVMPAKGGAPLTRADVVAVASYVWALGHQKE
jgi:glucose/arabinose dehydrogenase